VATGRASTPGDDPAGKAERARRKRLLDPIEVIVVPRGKHLLALPEMQSKDEKARNARSGAAGVNATVAGPDGILRRIVAIPEESLDGPPQRLARHELIHLMGRLASDNLRRQLEALEQTAAQNRGPYFYEYGARRGEFVTTCGEAFFGAAGTRGIEWLKDSHRELYELFRSQTGRSV
jgi:hypothetical protein